MDTLGTKIIVLVSEVSLFQQGGDNVYLYKVGTQSSVLINQVSLFQGCPLRAVPLYNFECTNLAVASFPGSPLAPMKNKNRRGGMSLGTRLV